MENIGLSGFDGDGPNKNGGELIVRLADCGSSRLCLPKMNMVFILIIKNS